MARALIGLGSNVGDRAAQLESAVRLLREIPRVNVERVSRWHETSPIGGPPGQEPFLNGAAMLETSLSPEQLHQALIEIEDQLGRRRQVRWQARTLDLDLLLYNQLEQTAPELTIPHPRFAFRKFAIEPAAEIAPDWQHPTAWRTLSELRDHLRSARPYVAITGLAGMGKTRLARALAEHFSGRLISSPQLPFAASNPRAAGASGRVLAWELELLAERAALLSLPSWPGDTPLVVSDFWLGQWLAFRLPSMNALDAAAQDQLWTRYQATVRSVVAPKLVVLLSRFPGSDDCDADLRSDRSVERWIGRFARRYVGPVLRLPADNPDAALTELTAAVAAMT